MTIEKKEFAFMSLDDIKNKIDEYDKNRIKKVIIHNYTTVKFQAIITKSKTSQSTDIFIYTEGNKDPMHKFDDNAIDIYGIDLGNIIELSLSPNLEIDKNAKEHMKRNNN